MFKNAPPIKEKDNTSNIYIEINYYCMVKKYINISTNQKKKKLLLTIFLF